MSNQITKLKSQGYCIIENFLDTRTVQEIVDYINSLHTIESEDIHIENGLISGLKYVFDKNDIFLHILSDPKLVTLLGEVYGENELILPTWEDIIIKQPLGNDIIVHQDLPPEIRNHSGNIYAFGICLTDTSHNPVYMLPQSHFLGALTKYKAQEIVSKNKELFVPMIAKAGDLVVHNNLTIHYSERNNSNLPRYTWYLEFRTINDIISNSDWDLDWAYSRRYLLYHSFTNRITLNEEKSDLKFPDLEKLLTYSEPLKLRIPH